MLSFQLFLGLIIVAIISGRCVYLFNDLRRRYPEKHDLKGVIGLQSITTILASVLALTSLLSGYDEFFREELIKGKALEVRSDMVTIRTEKGGLNEYEVVSQPDEKKLVGKKVVLLYSDIEKKGYRIYLAEEFDKFFTGQIKEAGNTDPKSD